MYALFKPHPFTFLILISIIGFSIAVTDISLTNCPSSYLKSTPQQTQRASIDYGKGLYAAYQSQSNKQSYYKIIIQGDTNEFFDFAVRSFIPYIIVGLIFLIIMAFVVLWCLFSRTCPPWEWTKRDLMLNPYTSKEMRYTFVWVLLFAIGILILSVFILSEIPNLKTNIQQAKCSLFVTVDTALNGGPAGSGWNGFIAFRDNVGNISSLISSTLTQIGLYFTGDQWLIDEMTSMKTKNNIIYQENKDSQLVSTNPYKTDTQIKAGYPAPLIDSLFIRKGMGPVGQADRMTTQLQISLNVTQKLSNQAHIIDQAARFLDDSAFTIKSNFIITQNTLNMYIYQLEEYLIDLQLVVEEYFTKYFSQFLYAVQIIIAVCLVGTMLSLIGSFSTAAFHILDCRKMVHLGWVFYSCSFIGGLILIYLFVGLGSIGYSFCEYYDGLLTGTDVFQTVRNQNTQNILNKVDACLYGDGNVISSFGVSEQIKTLESLFKNIKTYDDYTNTSSDQWIDTQESIRTFNRWIDIIQKYKLGIFIDSNSSQTNQDNPNYALAQLNLYSNTGGGVPTCSRDRWVFDKTNCTDPGEKTYETLDQTNGATFTTNKVLCISFNEGYSADYNRSWNQEDFAKRYVQIRKDCNVSYDMITKFGNVLISFRDSRINLFQGIQDSLNQILQQNNDFNEMLANFRSRVTQFSDSTKTLKNLIISQTKGIYYASNCTVVGQKIKDTYTVFCRNFMSQIVRMGILSIVLTILIIGGIWVGSLFAVRYSEIQKNERLNMPEEVDSERVISDKKSEDSD